jgi:recombination protein RecT
MTNLLPALKSLTEYVSKGQASLKQSLPQGMSVERFIANANSAIMTHPQRDKLAEADRTSIFTACKKAASDGLMLDGREAALIVFNTKQGNSWVPSAQYIPMTQGLVKLARNSGEIASIDSEVVFENDVFKYGYNLEGNVFEHTPLMTGDRGKPILVWALIRLKDGSNILRALSYDDIMNVSRSSKIPKNYDPKEGQHWKEFWRKAAIKNVLKYAPKTTELDRLQGAIENDDATEFDYQEEIIVQEKKTELKEAKKTKAESVIEDDVIDIEIVEDMPMHDEYTDEELPV